MPFQPGGDLRYRLSASKELASATNQGNRARRRTRRLVGEVAALEVRSQRSEAGSQRSEDRLGRLSS